MMLTMDVKVVIMVTVVKITMVVGLLIMAWSLW